MTGGIFPGKPFKLNIKCIIFTAMLAGSYWYLPPKNKWILLLLLWLPYIMLAYYDYAYDCQTNKLEPTAIPFGRVLWLPFKPQGYKDKYNNLSEETKSSYDKVDHIALWTLLVIAGFYIKVKFFNHQF
jgi:hypothetical protein